MNKIHIMHVIHSLGLGGMEKVVVRLVNNMAKDIFSSSICCLEEIGYLGEEINQEEVKIFNLQKKPAHDWMLFLRLAKLFRREGVQIVHTRGWPALFDGIMAAWLARVPVIIHSEHGRTYEDLLCVPRRRIWTQKLLLSYLTDKVFAVSQDLRRSIINEIGLKEEKIITIYNGLELNRFDLTVDLSKKRREIGCHLDDLIVGTVGRLDPVKGYPTLLQAASIITQNFPKARFVFVGDGPSADELKKLTCALGLQERVIFLGARNDTPELLKIMDVFVLSSLSEGLSNTILEAMAACLPIVATNVGGNSELVMDGQTGFLVPAKDSCRLANVIISLLKDPEQAKKMGQAGRIRVEEHFSLQKMIAAYQELYLSLIEKGSRY